MNQLISQWGGIQPVQLNVREGSKPYACFSWRPTPAHYRETGRKLVQDLLDQCIIQSVGPAGASTVPRLISWRSPAESR